jgi:hypothetical protein
MLLTVKSLLSWQMMDCIVLFFIFIIIIFFGGGGGEIFAGLLFNMIECGMQHMATYFYYLT